MARQYYVYILANTRVERAVLYVGVTNDLARRVAQHRLEKAGFTGRYKVTNLVYFESTDDIHAAIRREKQIKGWTRAKKLALVGARNPTWSDLAPATKEDPSLRSG